MDREFEFIDVEDIEIGNDDIIVNIVTMLGITLVDILIGQLMIRSLFL